MPDMNDNVITAVKLTKTFRDFWLREKVTAVSELDLEIRPREVFGLLGPNGSGKSTTIKMILGLLFPTKGRIAIYGRPPTDVTIKARIGFLPEESYLYPFLNARETLDFYGRLFHQNRTERLRRIDMLLEMVGLAGVAYRRVGEYSKGMQRRIGLAQALINDPELLILDEPTSGMDPIGTAQFKELIRMLAQRGKTILLSSHLLADVEDVCDRVCILYGGKQRALGCLDDLLAQTSQTQITTDQLDPQTLKKLNEVLHASGRKVISVGTPKDRLESLFLRIVKEAQEQRVTTGGALAGGQVAEFLRGEGEADGRELIQNLVMAGQGTASQEKSAGGKRLEEVNQSSAVSAPPAKEVIDDLIEAASEKKSVQPAPAQPSRPVSQPQADRGVIDELLGKNPSDHGNA